MVVLESIGLNLAAAGLAKGGARGAEKVRGVLQRRKYSDEIDDLETAFHDTLKQELSESVAEIDDEISSGTVIQNWQSIAKRLDEIDVIFNTEQEAVRRIAVGIWEGLQEETAADDLKKDDLEPIVADAYSEILRTFQKQIADTELADTLVQEAEIELTTRVNEVLDRLDTFDSRRREIRDAELRNQGFVRLSPAYFARRVPDPPARCWRTGFEITEVHTGYSVPREAEAEDGTRYRIVDTLIEELAGGEDCVMLGPPGSGKSTICKEVACQWYDEDRGTVFYRLSDRSKSLTDCGTLEERIRNADDHVLVVVEDAIRDDSKQIFHLIKRFRHDGRVTFLLDSREGEWHGSDTTLADAKLQDIKDRNLNHHTVPRIDERECERIVNHFEATTDTSVADSPRELFKVINSASGVGEVLQLSYHLSFYINVSEFGGTQPNTGITSLEKTVQNIINKQYNRSDLSLQFGILLNLLNATDIDVYPELLHTLASNEDDHENIDDLLKMYDGELVFSKESCIITEQKEPLRTNHEFWSTLYLQELLEEVGTRTATRLFENCLQSMLRVFDEPERRREINQWFRHEMPFFQDIESDQTAAADRTVESLFEFGRRQPDLAPLFGTTKFSSIEIPGACSPDLEVRVALWRGIMYYHSGDFETAESEFKEAQRLVEENTNNPELNSREIRGWCENYLGAIERDRGDLEDARQRHRKNEKRFAQIDDRSGLAFTWYNSGKLYWVKSDFETAEKHLKKAAKTFDDIGDRRFVSVTMNTMGLVHRDRGEYDKAIDQLESSLENARSVGDERSEARCLNHLGEVENYRGNHSAAKKYYQRGLKIARKIGDKQAESWLVHNIGTLRHKQGNLDEALKSYQRSREMEQEMGYKRGVAITYNYEAEINQVRGDYQNAIEKIEKGLKLVREVGDRRREGELLKTRGVIAKNRGNLEDAEKHLSDSLGIFDTIGDRKWRAEVLIELGAVALRRNSVSRAENLYLEALEIKREIDDKEGEAQAVGGLGRLAQRRGNYVEAENRYQESLTLAEDLGQLDIKAYATKYIGNLARERGELDAAMRYFQESYNMYTDIGDRRRLAKIERLRGQTAHESGDLSTAQTNLCTALESYQKVGDQLGKARTLSALAELQIELGNEESAQDHLEACLEEFEAMGLTRDVQEHVQKLIDVNNTLGKPIEGLESKLQALY